MSLLQRLCGSAEQPDSARSFTSLSEVASWLATLPDVEGNDQLQKIKAALPILENPKGKRDLLQKMCEQWGQEQWRNNRPLPAPVLAQELTAKVLAASNVVDAERYVSGLLQREMRVVYIGNTRAPDIGRSIAELLLLERTDTIFVLPVPM